MAGQEERGHRGLQAGLRAGCQALRLRLRQDHDRSGGLPGGQCGQRGGGAGSPPQGPKAPPGMLDTWEPLTPTSKRGPDPMTQGREKGLVAQRTGTLTVSERPGG